MRQIDYNLPPTHPLNIEAAKALGLTWSERDRLYLRRGGKFPTGSEGNNDNRWGKISDQEAVHCHR